MPEKTLPYVTELEYALSLCEQDGITPADDADALLYLAVSALRQYAWTKGDYAVEPPTISSEMMDDVLHDLREAFGGYVD